MSKNLLSIILQKEPISKPKNNTTMKKIYCIKIGGSLITDKSKPYTPKLDIIDNLCRQIGEIKRQCDCTILIGNGGGSFPHFPAVTYEMKQGLVSDRQKDGYPLVADAAAQLNRIVVKHLIDHGLRAVSLQPSACITTNNGVVDTIYVDSLAQLLKHDFVPVVYGDIVMDSIKGSEILSTEIVLMELVGELKKKNTLDEYDVEIVHCTNTEGVLDPNGNTIPLITQENFNDIEKHIYATEGYDVTGGMLHKIQQSLEFAQNSGVASRILNPNGRHLIEYICNNQQIGTLIK